MKMFWSAQEEKHNGLDFFVWISLKVFSYDFRFGVKIIYSL